MNHFQPQNAGPSGLPSGSFGVRRGMAGWSPALRRLLLAPHRPAFAAGSLLLVASALWWAGVLLAPALGWPLPLQLAPGLGQAWLLAAGAWPLFLAGLVCAALPRWLGCAPLAARLLLAPLAAVLGGWALALAGMHLAPLAGALGLALVAVGLALLAGLVGLTWLEHRHGGPGAPRAGVAAAGLLVLALCTWCAAVCLALGQPAWLPAALQLALWLGLVPLMVSLLHVAPAGLSAGASSGVPAGGRLQAAAGQGNRQGWLLRSVWAWLGVAAGLTVLQPGAAAWAPLLMGGLGSLVLALGTTTTLQQLGRRPRIDNAVWFSAWAAQGAALVATLAPLWPALHLPLHLLAAQCWLAAMAHWAWHLRPSLLRLPAH